MKRIILVLLALALMLSLLASCSSKKDKNGEIDVMTDKEIAALRNTKVFETDNFVINGTMMKYMLNRYVAENHLLLLTCGFYANASARDQSVNVGGMNSLLFSLLTKDYDKYKDFNGTWYDLLWNITSDEARHTLAFCELAVEMGIVLDAEDKDSVDQKTLEAMNNLNVYNTAGNSTYTYYQTPELNFSNGDFVFSSFSSDQYYVGDSFGKGIYQIITGGNGVYSDGFTSYESASGEGNYQIITGGNAVYGDGFTSFEGNIGDAVQFETVYYSAVLNPQFSVITDSLYASSYNAIYGTGVSEDDIHRVIELETLAEKCYNTASEELRASIISDSAKISSYFEKHKDEFYKADYLSFTLPVSGDVEYDTSLMTKCKTEEEFRVQAIKLLFDYHWEQSYDKTIVELQKGQGFGDGRFLTDSDIPSYNEIEEKINRALETVIQGLLNGKNADELPCYRDTLYDEVVHMVRNEVYEKVKQKYDGITVKYGRSKADSEADSWTLAVNRAAGDVKSFMSDGDKSIEVRFIVKPRYIDDTFAVSFGHILLSAENHKTDEEALRVAEQLLSQLKNGSLTMEKFEALALENTEDTGVFYNDVIPEDMVDGIDDWLFDSDRRVGDLDIVKTVYGYHVVYLSEATDTPAWMVEAAGKIYDEDFKALVAAEESGCEIKYCGDSVKKSIEIVGKRMLTQVQGSSGNPSVEVKPVQ